MLGLGVREGLRGRSTRNRTISVNEWMELGTAEGQETSLPAKIITPVHEPTVWVSSLTYTKQPNERWRICLDPK